MGDGVVQRRSRTRALLRGLVRMPTLDMNDGHGPGSERADLRVGRIKESELLGANKPVEERNVLVRSLRRMSRMRA